MVYKHFIVKFTVNSNFNNFFFLIIPTNLYYLRWWSDLGLAEELEFARDQPLKWYICSMACLTDPELSDQRIDLTKPISFIYIIDDIFDVHGTLEELTLFTEAINKYTSTALIICSLSLSLSLSQQFLLINKLLYTDGILLVLSNYPNT